MFETKCDDCNRPEKPGEWFLIVAADLGDGAFFPLLCDQCWHRRQYKAKLRQRLIQSMLKLPTAEV